MTNLPTTMQPLPTDIAFPGDEPVGHCLCSRCCEPIDDRITPIWMWTEGGEWAWRFHPACVGIQDVEYEDDDWADWMQEEADDEDKTDEELETDDEQLDLGACCACGESGSTVRNFLSLHKRAPQAGTGWGCFTCGLPMDGATAVVCDRCLESGAEIKEVIDGYPADKQRLAINELDDTPFEHDMSKH